LKAGSIISIGSSTVLTLTSSVATRFSVEYSVVVLPEPVGPVTRMMPCGRLTSSSQRWASWLRKAQCVQVFDRVVRVKNAHHHLFAKGGGQGGDAHFNLVAPRVARS